MPDKTLRQPSRIWIIALVVLFIVGPVLGVLRAPWWVLAIAIALILLVGWTVDSAVSRRRAS